MVVFQNLLDVSQDRRWDSGCGLIDGIYQDALMFCQVSHSRVTSGFCSFVSIHEQSCHDWPYIEDPEINRCHSAQPWLEFCECRLRCNQCQVTCVALTVSHTPPHISPAHIHTKKSQRNTHYTAPTESTHSLQHALHQQIALQHTLEQQTAQQLHRNTHSNTPYHTPTARHTGQNHRTATPLRNTPQHTLPHAYCNMHCTNMCDTLPTNIVSRGMSLQHLTHCNKHPGHHILNTHSNQKSYCNTHWTKQTQHSNTPTSHTNEYTYLILVSRCPTSDTTCS